MSEISVTDMEGKLMRSMLIGMSWVFLLGLAVLIGPLPVRAESSDINFAPVALSYDPAPGEPGLRFRDFSDTVLNEPGDLAFYGHTTSLRDGIWFRDRTGDLSLLAIRSGAAPGLGGVLFDDVREYTVLNNAGQLVFGSSLKGTGVDTSNDFSLWFRSADGNVSLLIREGDPAPGWPNSPPFTSFFNRYDLNDAGEVAFTGQVDLGPGPIPGQNIIRPGIWLRNSAGSISLAVRFGDAAPGTGSDFFGFYGQPQLTNAGRLIFEARAQSSGGDHGVWFRDSAGNITAVAFEGNAAPGIPGVVLGKTGTSSTPRMRKARNDGGEVALFSIISGSGVTAANDHAIWLRDTSGNFSLIAREGDPAPGTQAGVTYAALLGSTGETTSDVPRLNNAGDMVYSASLAGPGVDSSNDEGIWFRGSTGTLNLAVRKGDHIPGTATGTVIAGFPAAGGFDAALNDAGDMLLAVGFSGPGVDASNDHGLIMWNAADGARIFVREGEEIRIAPDDSRVITYYLVGGLPGLNNAGAVAVATGFESTYGVFYATANIPPVAQDDLATVIEGGIVTIDLAANDADPEDALDPATIAIYEVPQYGTIESINLDGTVSYRHNGSETVSDDFQYTIKDVPGMDSSPASVSITVTPVNDAPSGADATITMLEDAAHTFIATNFGFSDVDNNALLAVHIATVSGAGTLTNDGALVKAGDIISSATIAAGHLVFTPASDANGSDYASFTFQVQDDGGTADGGVDLDPIPNTITVDVTSVNDAPGGTDTTVITLENTDYTFSAADFGFSDTDGNALLAVQLSTLPSAGTLRHQNADVTSIKSISAADIAGDDLQFRPAPAESGIGYASFTFQIQDDGGTADGGEDLDPIPNTMTITVFNTPTCTVPTECPSGVEVTPISDVTVTFPTVTVAGQTTAYTTGALPTGCPGSENFEFDTLDTCYDVSTTAQYGPPVEVCFTLPGEDVMALTIGHDDPVDGWKELTADCDITITTDCLIRYPADEKICARVDSLSWFVVVRDTTAPAFTVEKLKDTLWPPNHKLAHVATVKDVSDAVDPSPTVDIQITSSEAAKGKGKGKDKDKRHGYDKTAEDWEVRKVNDTWEVWLRAERSGKADRVYTINAVVTDASGNEATDSFTVKVPHDKGKR